MQCELCHERPARETVKSKHVCRSCARTLKPDRQARYLKRRAERTATERAKAKFKAEAAAKKPKAEADKAEAEEKVEVQ